MAVSGVGSAARLAPYRRLSTVEFCVVPSPLPLHKQTLVPIPHDLQLVATKKMDHHRDHNAHMQPGLEVVQQHLLYSQEPEVWNDSTYAKEMVVPKHTQQHYSPGPSQSPQAVLAPLEEQERKRRRKRWFVIGGVVAAVVILAAVLGGVLGSKNASKSGGSSASNSIGTTSGEPSATALPQKLARQGSPLGVTTKRKTDGGADTFLFYQDRDGAVGYARCDSSRPLKDNESCWRTNGSFHTFASSNTQLAATDLVFETRFQVCCSGFGPLVPG